MRITVVLGTAREGRRSERVAKYVFEMFKKRKDISVAYADVRDLLKTFHTKRYEDHEAADYDWYGIANDTDIFVFVLPEYNRGYPGEWKLLMDSLYKPSYLGKKAALVGVSSGQFGAVRALELATLSLSTRGMYVMKDALYFARVRELFNGAGELISDFHREKTESFVDQVLSAS